MEERHYTFGQNIYVEGDKDDNMYFIMDGEFEMTKDIYIQQESNRLGFRRMVLNIQQPFLDKLINQRTQAFCTTDEKELRKLKFRYKNAYKNTTRMCLLATNETCGLIENIVDAPYRIFNVK